MYGALVWAMPETVKSRLPWRPRTLKMQECGTPAKGDFRHLLGNSSGNSRKSQGVLQVAVLGGMGVPRTFESR